MEKLDKYFERCIKDAYESEGRDYKSEKVEWFYIVVDNQILFSICTPFIRVDKKAIRRIRNNITKNFGLDNNRDYFIDTILQPNFVCNYFKVGNKDYFLCEKMDCDKMEKGEVIGSGRYEKLCKAYYGVSTDEFRKKHDELHLPSNISWNYYRETFFKAFGKYPEVKIVDKSKTVED